jgi:hypothetical protein
MNHFDRTLDWLRRGIPSYLDECASPKNFIKRFNMDCASFYWYQFAVEAAILRWPAHRKELEKLRKN